MTIFHIIGDPIDIDKEGNSLTLQDIMSSDDNIFDHIDLRLKSEQMYNFIEKNLSPREKKILIMRYGLFCTTPLTQREVADALGISRSYVSRHAYCKSKLDKPNADSTVSLRQTQRMQRQKHTAEWTPPFEASPRDAPKGRRPSAFSGTAVVNTAFSFNLSRRFMCTIPSLMCDKYNISTIDIAEKAVYNKYCLL